MADAQDQANAAQEPSMEEILASIRKIISDDDKPEEQAVEAAAAPAAADEVIELTQEVKDDGSVADVTAPVEEAVVVEQKQAPTPMPVAEGTSLVSETTVSASASALSSLANTVEIERLATTPQTVSFIGNGSRTLEDMALELMRPLLKEWLDKNLPATVDRLVQKEIERISKKV